MPNRELRQEIARALTLENDDLRRQALRQRPRAKVLRALYSLLSDADERLKQRAAEAMGDLVAEMSEASAEAGRVHMRRLIWSLTEESGGAGWGAPLAMAEIMARHEGLAREFGPILVSFVGDEESRLDHPPLLREAIQAVGRLAAARPGLARELEAGRALRALLSSPDAAIRDAARKALERQ